MEMRRTDYYQLKEDLLFPSAESRIRSQERIASPRTDISEIVEDLLTEVVNLRKEVEKLQGLTEDETPEEELRSQLIAELKDDLISSAEHSLRLREQVLSAEERLLFAQEELLAVKRENFELKQRVKTEDSNPYPELK